MANFGLVGWWQIFYFIGFGFFCLESLVSIWVIQVLFFAASIIHFDKLKKEEVVNKLLLLLCVWEQQVYMYFRGSGKAAEMKQEATRRAMMAAL